MATLPSVSARPPVMADAVAVAPVPGRTATALDRLCGTQPDLPDRMADPGLTAALVAVTSASRSLARVLDADPVALDVLSELGTRAPEEAADGDQLLAWKRRELLRIAAR